MKKLTRTFSLITIISISGMMTIFAQIGDDKDALTNDLLYWVVDTMPRFKGEGEEAFRKYVVQELHKSPIAKESKKRGEISCQFIINQNGELINPTLISGMKNEINSELLRILSNSPKWEPGWQSGQLVNVVYTLRCPVNFKSIR